MWDSNGRQTVYGGVIMAVSVVGRFIVMMRSMIL